MFEWLTLQRKRIVIHSSIKEILNLLAHYHNADLNLKQQVLNIENFCNDLINMLEANPEPKRSKKSNTPQEIQETLENSQKTLEEKQSRLP